MGFSFLFTLFLIAHLMQCLESKNEFCQQAVDSVKEVDICPTSEKEYNDAARKKDCEKVAVRQNCSVPEKFKYHCVINVYINSTLEVCAPEKLIPGFCTEFNIGGGIIQLQLNTRCKDTGFPKCGRFYNSSEAYKHQDCYEIVYKKRKRSSTSPSPTPENRLVKILLPIFAFTIVVVVAVAFIYAYRKKKLCYKNRKETKTSSEKELENLMKESENTEQGRIIADKARKADLTTNKYGESKVIYLKETRTGDVTIADRHARVTCKRKEDLSKENKEESKKYLGNYETFDKYFVETSTYLEGEQVFKKYGNVVWTGIPGCGKTLAAIHLILKEMNQDKKWTFRKISSINELTYIVKDKKTLIFIDNIFYHATLDSVESWWRELTNVFDEFSSDDQNRLRFIITARTNVIERASSRFNYTPPMLGENLRTGGDYLAEEEKRKILSRQIDFANTESKSSILNMDDISKHISTIVTQPMGPIGFPLCAHLFVWNEEYQKSKEKFFSSPIELLKHQIKYEIENDKSNRTKSLFFLLFFHERNTKMGRSEKLQIKSEQNCIRFLEKNSADLLRNFAPFDFTELQNEAERLLGAFLKEENDGIYRFVHDSVYEAVGVFWCDENATKTAKYFPLDIIQNQNYQNINDKERAILAARLIYETLDQRLSEVFSCRVFRNPRFVECFMSELEKKEDNTVRTFFTDPNASSKVKLPCMFWTSCNKLTYLTQKLYEMTMKKDINRDYQFYVMLYGKCCAAKEGLLNTVNGMLFDNLKAIKQLVTDFKDKPEENSILHLLISSQFPDSFATDVIEKLLMDGFNVDARNKNKITPLMLAVDQAKERTNVVQTLIKHNAKLHYRDSKGHSVFIHCLSSDKDDEKCANYLRILLNGTDAKRSLVRDDLEGNTALCVAAKEDRFSRIQSMLLMLENGPENAIKTLNDAGRSPLQLSVSFKKQYENMEGSAPQQPSLKKQSAHMELECCVRVILLILFGGNQDNQSDTNNVAINECEYDSIKKILQTPEEDVMINALVTILSQTKESKEGADPSPVLSDKLSKQMQENIRKAVRVLKNCKLNMHV